MKTLALLTILLSTPLQLLASNLPTTVNMEILTPLNDVLAKPGDYLDRDITIEGEVIAVCKSRGCWAELATNDGQKIRLKVRDGETVIPMSARGKHALATGQLTALNLSKQQATLYLEHMAKDAGEAFDRASVTQGITIYNLRPSALKIIYN